MKILDVSKDEQQGEIRVEFEERGKHGIFWYSFTDREITQCDYEEDEGEDIYDIIHEWVGKHTSFESKITVKYKEDSEVLA